jgi:serine/threonine-protein kinase RsbW
MPNNYRVERVAHLDSLCDFRDFLKGNCDGWPGITNGILYDIQLAVDEACANIITHGYKNMEPGLIILDLELNPDCLRIDLTDFGYAFDPADAPAPDFFALIEGKKCGGFGVYFIKKLVDSLEYSATLDGNKMTLTKYLATDRKNDPEGFDT